MTHQNVIISDQDMELKLNEFQQWIENQPELPQNIGKKVNKITKCFN